MVLVAAFAAVLFRQLPSELSPIEDRGTIVALGIAPEGSTPAYTDRYVKRMEAIFRDTPFVERFFTVIGFSGVTQGINFVRLVDWDQRPVKQQDVTKSLFPKLFAIPGLLAFASQPALARPEPDRQAGPVRAADLPALRGAAGGGRPDAGGGAAESRACRISTATSSSTSRSSRSASTARRRRCWASMSTRSAARSRPCWAAGRSRASSARASSTTSSCSSRTSTGPTPTTCARSSSAAATAAWWRCRTWSGSRRPWRPRS